MKRTNLIAFKSLSLIRQDFFKEFHVGEIAIFMAVIAVYDNKGVITQYDIRKLNSEYSDATTQRHLYSLINKGFITSLRSNKYFSRSYISLTPKGLLLKRSINKYLSKSIKDYLPEK